MKKNCQYNQHHHCVGLYMRFFSEEHACHEEGGYLKIIVQFIMSHDHFSLLESIRKQVRRSVFCIIETAYQIWGDGGSWAMEYRDSLFAHFMCDYISLDVHQPYRQTQIFYISHGRIKRTGSRSTSHHLFPSQLILLNRQHIVLCRQLIGYLRQNMAKQIVHRHRVQPDRLNLLENR